MEYGIIHDAQGIIEDNAGNLLAAIEASEKEMDRLLVRAQEYEENGADMQADVALRVASRREQGIEYIYNLMIVHDACERRAAEVARA